MLVEASGLRKLFPVGGGVFRKSKQFSHALEDVSLGIEPGECFGLVGESGSGKSTLARCILNLITPSSGRVLFDGKTIFDSEAGINLDHNAMLPFRRDMQLIFQDPAASLDPYMPIGKIVMEGIVKHRIAEGAAAEKRAGDYLELCGISRSFFHQKPQEFSGGQKQRIGIARALAVNPRFIAADEPLSALDVSVQSQILNLLGELRRQYRLTFLFISHDLQTVEYFCDRIAVLYLGSVMEIGSAEDIVKRPLHPYTTALFSSAPKEESDAETKKPPLLKGEIPSSINVPPGCKFHTRCPRARPECALTRPPLIEAENGHFVACTGVI
jgi:oligopeptide/dipeptide ABC transporter ATP-binding protein